MITASALPRLLACPGASVLPRAENASAAADAGSAEHAELAYQLADGTLEPWIAEHIPPGSSSEVALGFDVATRVGRIIGDNLGRAYGPLGPFEIVGSADVVGIDGDAVIIADFKTGHSLVEPAATNAQLAFYALAASRALGKTRAIVKIIYTRSRRVDEAVLDAFDLAAFADRLYELHIDTARYQEMRSRGEIISTREGTHCKYCPSIPYCGAKTALLSRFASSSLAVVDDTKAMTPAAAATAYEQLVRIESLVRDARKRLESYVNEIGPIDLGNGRRYGRYIRSGNERLDGTVAVRAIADIIGEPAKEFESVAIERRTTKAAIERAAKQLGCKRGTASAVVKRIRELGGATHAPDSMPLGEYVAENTEAAPTIDLDEISKLLKDD